jgi:hypothetical protein
VGAAANVLSFGRFQNAQGVAAVLRWCESSSGHSVRGSDLGVGLTAVALALDDDGLDVVQQAVQEC